MVRYLLPAIMQLPLFAVFAAAQQCAAPFSFSQTWDVLGPFQIGTREAEWGADPLEKLGGFRALTTSNATFPSALPRDGEARWSTVNAQLGNGTAQLSIGYTDGTVDWDWLRSVYGWSGIQFQAWTRGRLVVCEESTAVVFINNVGEFWIDGEQYFGGDFYGYRRAPVVVRLQPGEHVIDVRVTHDIRNFGGGMPPVLNFAVEARKSAAGLVVIQEQAVISDVVEGKLVSPWASVPLRNEGQTWVTIEGISGSNNHTALSSENALRIAPGQTRPFKFQIKGIPPNATTLELDIRYRIGDDAAQVLSVSRGLNFISNWYKPQKYTFLHPSGVVSFAVIRPPSPNAPCEASSNTKAPILLSLHGAGVEVDNPASKEGYDALPDLCAWLVLPSGVTTWSGDDWHRWGFADVEAAIEAVPDWMKQVKWERQGIDLQKWVVSGHSNGGQGTWYALTHRNDKIIAAAPLSGYLSIPAYVPFHMWHEADPRKSAMVLASLNTYKHELLTPNMRGTPIMQQHGQNDDNVPVYHSRRMHQLVAEADWQTDYWEIPGQGHWWEGVMTDGGLSGFLTHYLNEEPSVSSLPSNFSVVVANPADTGSRGGIVVDQLEEPDRIGRIDVDRSSDIWKLTTSNIRRWHFSKERSPEMGIPSRVLVDGHELEVGPEPGNFLLSSSGTWGTSGTEWVSAERSGRQWGPLDAFLGSTGPFQIVAPSNSVPYVEAVALGVARNLFQYFAADSEIVDTEISTSSGNIVLINPAASELHCAGEAFPISFTDSAIEIQDHRGTTKRYKTEEGTGAIFLCPHEDERLKLILWGVDELGLRIASRLLPLRTGVGQPNFIIVGKETGWGGVAGTKALGMFDSQWKISGASYL